ncbi:hypothetical protein GE061_005216 [Apolygus lucorum]|uniref:Uncharacterized protein n=1 Tax=Apolygus lucorum TaxID=248454 RepID=A0A8S9WXG0_APOLU|nr:hypothetical protein GE061_005216 [Apolygus lucorum]
MKRNQTRKSKAWEEEEVATEDLTRKMEKFSIEQFQETEPWEEYEAQFLLRCRVKGLGGENAEEARRDLLLAYVGPKALKKVRTGGILKRKHADQLRIREGAVDDMEESRRLEEEGEERMRGVV